MNTERVMSIALFSIAMTIFIVMNLTIEALPVINKIGLVLAPAMALLIGVLAMNEAREQKK